MHGEEGIPAEIAVSWVEQKARDHEKIGGKQAPKQRFFQDSRGEPSRNPNGVNRKEGQSKMGGINGSGEK